MNPSRTAFSLIELLVALSILGVVAAIVVPKLIGVQGAATTTVAAQMQDELNKAWSQWQDAGGLINTSNKNYKNIGINFWSPSELASFGSGSGTSQLGVHNLLSSSSSSFSTNDGYGIQAPTLQDRGTSNQIRTTFPPDITAIPPASWNGAAASSNIAFCDNCTIAIVFDGTQFTAFPANLSSGWSVVASSGGSIVGYGITGPVSVGYGLSIPAAGGTGSSYALSGNTMYRLDYSGTWSGGMTYTVSQVPTS